MEIAAILAKQVAVMFLLVTVGIICKNTGILNEDHARALSNTLLLIVTPALIIYIFQTEWVPELLPAMGFTLIMAIVVNSISVFTAGRLCPDPGDESTAWKVSKVAIVFSNAGFMGFPLLLATVGEEGMLYAAPFLLIFNIFSWVWCAPMLSGARNLPFKQIATNPVIISAFAGLSIYLLRIRLPLIPYTFLSNLANVNTPISMMVIGVFLASVLPREALADRRVWLVVFTRNILLPLVTLLILWGIRVAAWLPGGRTFAIAFLIIVSCPSAAISIMMPARYGCDSSYGAKVVAISTAMSIFTIPLVMMLADMAL